MMEIGIGIDASLGLSFEESNELAREAATLGYTSVWTPSGPANRDGFQVCGQWHAALAAAGTPMATGIAVIPAPVWSVASLASTAGTLSDLTGGRFILGLGTGGGYTPEFRRMYGIAEAPPVALMRDYLVVLKRLLSGESVTYDGKAINVQGLRVAGKPLPVPLYIASLGPQMLRVAGEAADGVSLNWTAPAHRDWCRERVAESARRVGRDPGAITFMEYIRVCIDEDEEAARRAFVRSFMGYALARPGQSTTQGYRGHFGRMGFDEVLLEIEAKRDDGLSGDELIDAFPEALLREMGYYGKAAGAGAELRRLSAGLDTAVVRIVGVRPGMEAARSVVQACAPRAR